MAQKSVLRLQIRGTEWTFTGQTNRAYVRQHASKTEDACIYPDHREIYFNLASLLPRHVRHELFHAYVSLSDTYSIDMDKDDMEELGATIMGEHGPDIMSLTDKILDFFMRKGV